MWLLIFIALCRPADGTDAYAYAKKIGRFRLIKRTEGVSSTDIVGRMLMCTRVNPKLRQVRFNCSFHEGCYAACVTAHGTAGCILGTPLDPKFYGRHVAYWLVSFPSDSPSCKQETIMSDHGTLAMLHTIARRRKRCWTVSS